MAEYWQCTLTHRRTSHPVVGSTYDLGPVAAVVQVSIRLQKP